MSSRTDFSFLEPSEVLAMDTLELEQYEQYMRLFQSEMLGLNTTAYVLEQIIRFPRELFGYGDSSFFIAVIANFWDSALLGINRILNDGGPDTFTLNKVQSFVIQSIKPQYQLEVKKELKAIRIEGKLERIQLKIKKLRDAAIAHLLPDSIMAPDFTQQNRVTLQELKTLRDSISKWFNLISFGVGRPSYPLGYLPNLRNQSPTDIERILDAIVLASETFNLPEKNPNLWKFWSKSMLSKPENLTAYNYYRNKLGYPEVRPGVPTPS